MLEHLSPAAAREFEALLQRQARDEREHRANSTSAVDPGALLSARAASFATGCGGGRKRPTYPPLDDA